MLYFFILWCLFSWVVLCVARALRKQQWLNEECAYWLKDPEIIRVERQPIWMLHAWCLVCFMSPKKHYGPLMQSAWDRGYVHLNNLGLRWWQVYQKIYIDMVRIDRQRINRMMARKHKYPPDLETAIFIYTRADIDALIGWPKAAPAVVMSDAALEYEEIMQCQELSNSTN